MGSNSQGHSHHHHHHGLDEGDDISARLWISIGLNLVITIAEIVGGILSNSLALLSDALHNFGDTASLGISLIARNVSRQGVTEEKTFGYRRAEIIGAFINLITLVLISLFLIKEGIERFFDPQPIGGEVMLIVAVIGLLGNVITALLLRSKQEGSINIQSAYIHIMTDALSSVGVIIGGVLVTWYQLYVVDTILTVGIGTYILWHTYHMLRSTIDILMESKPEDIDLQEVTERITQLPKVEGMHHLHVWKLDEQSTCLEAHIVIDEEDLPEMEAIKTRIKKELTDRFDITHSTLEFECEPCGEEAHLQR